MEHDPRETPAGVPSEPKAEERPPLGSWVRMYAVVLGVLLVQILVFHLFTRAFE